MTKLPKTFTVNAILQSIECNYRNVSCCQRSTGLSHSIVTETDATAKHEQFESIAGYAMHTQINLFFLTDRKSIPLQSTGHQRSHSVVNDLAETKTDEDAKEGENGMEKRMDISVVTPRVHRVVRV